MKLYDELVARGLIAQVTNEAEIREMIDNGKATFYIGFDSDKTVQYSGTESPNSGLAPPCRHYGKENPG